MAALLQQLHVELQGSRNARQQLLQVVRAAECAERYVSRLVVERAVSRRLGARARAPHHGTRAASTPKVKLPCPTRPSAVFHSACMAHELFPSFDDMSAVVRELIRRLITERIEPTEEERNLVAVAFKNAVGQRRAAYRSVDDSVPGLVFYKQQLKQEAERWCVDTLDFIERIVLPNTTGKTVAAVFWFKMAGDYRRYVAELGSRPQNIQACDAHYARALSIASELLPIVDPLRLGVVLNYSVALFETLGKKDYAFKLAQATFDEAVRHIDPVARDQYKDIALIIQLLRDNMSMWKEAAGAAK